MRRVAAGGKIITLVAILFSAGCTNLAVYKSERFEDRQNQLHKIAVLEPAAKVYRVTFSEGIGEDYEILPDVQKNIADEIMQQLMDRGYEVSLLDSVPADPDGVVSEALYNVNRIFDQQVGEFKDKFAPRFREFDYSIGPDVNILADYAGADALVIARSFSFYKTKGEIMKDLAQTVLIAAATFGSVVYYQTPYGAFLQVAVVDADSGEILWYFHEIQPQSIKVENEKKLRKYVRRIIKAFPKAAAGEAVDPVVHQKSGAVDPSTMPIPEPPITQTLQSPPISN